MRITIDSDDLDFLIGVLLQQKSDKFLRIGNLLKNEYEKSANRNIKKKQASIKIATKARSMAVKEKIENSINILRIENKEITIYSVSKTAGVSYNSVKKYRNLIENNNY